MKQSIEYDTLMNNTKLINLTIDLYNEEEQEFIDGLTKNNYYRETINNNKSVLECNSRTYLNSLK